MAVDNPYARSGGGVSAVAGQIVEDTQEITSLAAATPTNITSITLPAGTWNLFGSVYAITNELVAVLQYLEGQISDISENLAASPFLSCVDFGGQNNCGLPFNYKPVVLTVETIFYLTIACQVSVTGSIRGNLSAVRFR